MMEKKTAKKLAAAAMLLALGGICIMSIKKASQDGRPWGSVEISLGGRAELQNTIELPLEKTKSLEIKYKHKNIIIYPAKDEKIVIKEYLISRGPQSLAQVGYGEDGKVTVTGGDTNTVIMLGFGFGERIEVYLPEKGLKELAVETGSGNITSEAGYLEPEGRLMVMAKSGNVKWRYGDAGELSFRSGSGNVKVEDIRGNVTAKTGSGNITGEKVEGTLDAKTGSGNITLEEFTGNGRMEAGSGNIKVEEGKITGDLALQTDSGNIKVELAGKIQLHFEIKTGSGFIKTDFGQQLSYNNSGNTAEGDVGEAPVGRFQAQTGSGNVYIMRE